MDALFGHVKQMCTFSKDPGCFFILRQRETERERQKKIQKKINTASPYTNCGLIVYLDLLIGEIGALFPSRVENVRKAF